MGREAPAPGLGDSTQRPREATERADEAEDASEDDRPSEAAGANPAEGNQVPEKLKRLTELKWPPPPDESIFTDPLKREDPKPLRPAELERIATSAELRALLANPTLRAVLAALDAFQSPKSRHAALARLLGVDAQSLARPAAAALMRRDSPPPLHALLGAVAEPGDAEGMREMEGGRDDWGAAGWWLGYGEKRVWVGPEERRLMRAWADAVTGAIGGWGMQEGDLAWEV